MANEEEMYVERALKSLGLPTKSQASGVKMVRGISKTPSGLKVVHDPNFKEKHRYSPETRAERRADNKHMAKVRKANRKRRKHGR